MSSASTSSGSASSLTGRSWRAGSLSRTSGAGAAAARARPGTRWSVDWRTSRWAGDLRHCWSRCGRYRCTGCGHVWRQDTTKAAEPRARLSRRGLRWALEGIVCQHLTVARVAEGLAVSWNTANDAVLAEGKRVLINDPGRFEGVKVIGVDEHVWRHTCRGDKYVTVIIDLTSIREDTGPARLLDMVEGRSKQAFKTWLTERPDPWREAVEVVAMGGFTSLQDRHHRGAARGGRGDGPLPRGAPGRRRPGSVPPPSPAAHPRPPRTQG